MMGRNTELELKARIVSWWDCKARLEALAGPGSAFSKDDAYWFTGDSSRPGIRVRRESKGETGGPSLAETRVTWKAKECRDGMEINDEREFDVSDGESFEELLPLMGLEKRTAKRKTGWRWEYRGITAELCEVQGCAAPGAALKQLGWFLELELLLAGPGYAGPASVEGARKRLLEMLEAAGIGRDQIEGRYYSELLGETRT